MVRVFVKFLQSAKKKEGPLTTTITRPSIWTADCRSMLLWKYVGGRGSGFGSSRWHVSRCRRVEGIAGKYCKGIGQRGVELIAIL